VKSEIYKKLIGAIVLGYCLGVILSLLLRPDALHWDFKVYYYAARAYATGVNPYDILVRASVEDSVTYRGRFMFVYPPAMLFLFSLFSSLEYVTALHLFLITKCVFLIGLLFLWRKGFLKGEIDLLFYLFCVVAFNSPIYIDLKAGNISIVEQFTLWLAFYFFLKRRLLSFCLFIIATAVFKGTPVLFLFLLLFLKDRKRYAYFSGAWCAFIAMQVTFYACAPSLFKDFLHSAGRVIYKVNQPSTFAFMGDLLQLIELKTAVVVPAHVHLMLFLGIIAAVVSLTWRSAVLLRSLSIADRERIMVFFACAAYVLVLPYFEDYSYIIMLVPAYFILKGSATRSRYAFLFLFTILSSATTTLPLVRPAVRIILVNSPLILTYLIWGLYMHEIALLSRSERGKQ